MVRQAEPGLVGALTAQMRTDELRELLERHPHLDRHESRRLRELYRDATATEIIAIMSSEELGRKAARLDEQGASASDVMLIAGVAIIVAILLALMLGLR